MYFFSFFSFFYREITVNMLSATNATDHQHNAAKFRIRVVMRQFEAHNVLHFDFSIIVPPVANSWISRTFAKMHHSIWFLTKLNSWLYEISRLTKGHRPIHLLLLCWESRPPAPDCSSSSCCCWRFMDAAPTCQSSLPDPLVSSGSHLALMHGQNLICCGERTRRHWLKFRPRGF